MAGIQAKQLDPSVPLGPWSWAGGQDGPLDISGAYSQTGDVYASTLRLRAGAVWTSNNWRIFCLTPPQIDAGAILACDGVDGGASSVGGAAGIAVVFGTLGQGFDGGAGGTSSHDGAPGGGPVAGGPFSYIATSGGAGGNAGGGGHGGVGGAPALPPERGLCLSDVIRYTTGAQTFDNPRQAGLGGGGGGSDDGGNPGGGGGSGAGEIQIWAPGLILGGTLRARGGRGGAGDRGPAGGGGGTGGIIRLMLPPQSLVLLAGGAFNVSGGLGGAGVSPGQPGGLGLVLHP